MAELQNLMMESGLEPPDADMATAMTAYENNGPSPMQGPPPKKQEELFAEIDSNEDGVIDQDELETLAEKISEETGVTIDTEDGIANYDSDGDGALSSEELKGLLETLNNNSEGLSSLLEGLLNGSDAVENLLNSTA